MDTINKKELDIALVNSNLTKKDLAKRLHICYVTLLRKINGTSDFTWGEMKIISMLFGEKVAVKIFFGN